MIVKRLGLTFINIFFPPLSILILCGPTTDLIINCLLFIAAVIPSHIHGFYISCTYFSRKRKVRKGVYPGKWRWGIYSDRVQNGGASSREIRRLKREMTEGKEVDVEKYDAESIDERSRSRRRASGYGNGYGAGVQQVPSRSRTRNSYQPDMSMTRNSGYQPDMSRTRSSGYPPDMQQVPSRSRTRNSGYGAQDVLNRSSSQRPGY